MRSTSASPIASVGDLSIAVTTNRPPARLEAGGEVFLEWYPEHSALVPDETAGTE